MPQWNLPFKIRFLSNNCIWIRKGASSKCSLECVRNLLYQTPGDGFTLSAFISQQESARCKHYLYSVLTFMRKYCPRVREMMIHSSLPSTWLHWRAHTPSTFTSHNAFLIHEGAAIVTLITTGKKWNKCWAKNMSVFLLHENEGSWKTVTSSWNKEDTMAGQTLYDPLPTMFVFTHSASSTFTACFM